MKMDGNADFSAFYGLLAAAHVRGEARRAAGNGGRIRSTDRDIDGRPLALPTALADAPLDALSEGEVAAILAAGREAGLKLYHFKRTHGELPRVRHVLGFLRSVGARSLLDVGSGRGAFLWPCLDALSGLEATALDLLPHRVEFLESVRLGGVDSLRAERADIRAFPGADAGYDVVTLLEVLEHIPDVAAAVRNAVRLAGRYVVASVPSRPDDNPEHIHLLTKDALTRLFADAGCPRLRFGGVGGHLIAVASKAD